MVFLLLAVASLAFGSCQYEIRGNTQYANFNLLPLRNLKLDWNATSKGSLYKMNFCGDMVSKCGQAAGVSGKFTEDGSCLQVLSRNWQAAQWTLVDPSKPRTGAQAVFSGGDPCVNVAKTPNATSTIVLKCDSKASVPQLSVTEQTCGAVFTVVSKHGCPKLSNSPSNDSVGTGWSLLFFFLLFVLLYLTVGGLIKRARGARGVEAIPNIDFWREFPDLVKDGAAFTYRRLRCQPDPPSFYEEELDRTLLSPDAADV